MTRRTPTEPMDWERPSERFMAYLDRLFTEVKRRDATTFEVTEDANTRYLDRMTELLGDSLFTLGNCASARSSLFCEMYSCPSAS